MQGKPANNVKCLFVSKAYLLITTFILMLLKQVFACSAVIFWVKPILEYLHCRFIFTSCSSSSPSVIHNAKCATSNKFYFHFKFCDATFSCSLVSFFFLISIPVFFNPIFFVYLGLTLRSSQRSACLFTAHSNEPVEGLHAFQGYQS